MKLSIIVPVFNEKTTVLKVLDQLKAFPIEKQIIVVDDYSTDGSRDLLIEAEKKYKDFKLLLHDKNMGKGTCIRTALPFLNGDYVIIRDADLEQDAQDILKLVQILNYKNYKAVFGARIFNLRYKFSIRYIANKIFTLFANILYKTYITDIMTGYKLIERNLFQNLNLSSRGFDVEAEITIKLLKRGVKIEEVPVNYYPRRLKDGKKIRAKHSFLIIYSLLKYRFVNYEKLFK